MAVYNPSWRACIKVYLPKDVATTTGLMFAQPSECYPYQTTWYQWFSLKPEIGFLDPSEYYVEALRHRELPERRELNTLVYDLLNRYKIHPIKRPYTVYIVKKSDAVNWMGLRAPPQPRMAVGNHHNCQPRLVAQMPLPITQEDRGRQGNVQFVRGPPALRNDFSCFEPYPGFGNLTRRPTIAANNVRIPAHQVMPTIAPFSNRLKNQPQQGSLFWQNAQPRSGFQFGEQIQQILGDVADVEAFGLRYALKQRQPNLSFGFLSENIEMNQQGFNPVNVFNEQQMYCPSPEAVALDLRVAARIVQ